MKQIKNLLTGLTLSVALLSTPVFAEKLTFTETQELALEGDTDAQLNLGDMYTIGRVVPQDYDEAIKWLKKAASGGNTKASSMLVNVKNLKMMAEIYGEE